MDAAIRVLEQQVPPPQKSHFVTASCIDAFHEEKFDPTILKLIQELENEGKFMKIRKITLSNRKKEFVV